MKRRGCQWYRELQSREDLCCMFSSWIAHFLWCTGYSYGKYDSVDSCGYNVMDSGPKMLFEDFLE